MSDLHERFGRAQARFNDLVQQVKPDQWGDPTPCTDWNVRALVNHLVYEARWLPPLMAGKTIAEVGDAYEGDLLGDDPVSSYEDALRQATAAVQAPGALERTVHLSYDDVPTN